MKNYFDGESSIYEIYNIMESLNEEALALVKKSKKFYPYDRAIRELAAKRTRLPYDHTLKCILRDIWQESYNINLMADWYSTMAFWRRTSLSDMYGRY